jgi:N utilization substance protein B
VSARSKSRKRALDILYGADVRDVPIAELLGAEAERAEHQPERNSSWAYARVLVEGVDAHLESIDETIEAHAQGWTLARMPALDRAIARLATWEIVHNDEVPDPVAIAEAIEFATTLSTDDSAGFLNGVLGAIARSKSA